MGDDAKDRALDLDALRKLADEAAAGPWVTDYENARDLVCIAEVGETGMIFADVCGRQAIDRATGEYIAAANPQAVLTLLGEIERLRAEVGRLSADDDAQIDAALTAAFRELCTRAQFFADDGQAKKALEHYDAATSLAAIRLRYFATAPIGPTIAPAGAPREQELVPTPDGPVHPCPGEDARAGAPREQERRCEWGCGGGGVYSCSNDQCEVWHPCPCEYGSARIAAEPSLARYDLHKAKRAGAQREQEGA